jgi:starvation-inducible DNA-binding protein
MTAIANTPSETVRCKTAELLNRHLAAAVDLREQVEEAQRTIGAECIAIHELLGQVTEAVGDYSDTICERRAALGTIKRMGKETGEVALGRPLFSREIAIADDGAQIAAVSNALAAFGDATRKAVDETASFGDADTSEVFTELSRSIDYHLWLVESHLNRPIALRHRDSRQFGLASRKFTGFYPDLLAAERGWL